MRLINIVPLFPDRIDYMVAEAKRLYAAAGLDEVMLCMTLHPEGEQPAEKVELFRRIFRQYRAALQASGIKVGILFQSLIGHGWPGAPAGVASWPRVETVDGEPSDRYCILNPDFRDYLAATVRTMAAEKPFALLVDDDFRQIDGHGLECFCPRHLAQFNAGNDRPVGADELRSRLRAASPQDSCLRRFETLRVGNLLELAALVRRAIDEVAPEINCGYCTPGYEMLSAGRIAGVLAGRHRPFIRLCNANYLERDIRDLPAMHYRTQALKRMMPAEADLLDESDTFPHHRYSKAAVGLDTKLTLAAWNGLDGAKLWLTNLNWPDAAAEAPYDAVLAANRRRYAVLRETMRSARPTGLVTPLPSPASYRKLWHPLRPWECFYAADWQCLVTNHYGIPGRYAELGEGDGIFLVSGDMLRFFSDAEVAALLEKRLLLDGSAALALAERGFETDLGVGVVAGFFRCGCELDLATGARLPFMNDGSAPLLTPLSERTLTLSQLQELPYHCAQQGTPVGSGVTVFDNSRGGRVAVWSQPLTMPMLLHPLRRRLLIRTLERLNGGRLEVAVESDQDVLALSAGLPAGELLLVCNLNFDCLKEIELRLKAPVRRLERLTGAGEWCETACEPLPDGIRIPHSLYPYENIILKISR